ncbi:hypothetical protein ACU8KH_01503 [Lachancea thermotolerans]
MINKILLLYLPSRTSLSTLPHLYLILSPADRKQRLSDAKLRLFAHHRTHSDVYRPQTIIVLHSQLSCEHSKLRAPKAHSNDGNHDQREPGPC